MSVLTHMAEPVAEPGGVIAPEAAAPEAGRSGDLLALLLVTGRLGWVTSKLS
jgi:hypothetical protein